MSIHKILREEQNKEFSKQMYQAISLTEFVLVVGTILLTIVTRNIYIGIIASFFILKQIPEKILKKNITGSISNRPDNAVDCNMINKGGDASWKPGFPSGHSTIASFFCFFLLYQFMRYNRDYNKKVYILPIIGILLIVLVPYSRVKLSCHTKEQVYGGILLGFLLFLLFIYLEKKVFMNIQKYKNDRKKVDDFILSGFNEAMRKMV